MIDQSRQEQEEIELLLPWFEKGTLSASEMQRVETYLTAHPELHAQLALIREEVTEAITANETHGMPGSAARARLMDRLTAEGDAAPKSSPRFISLLSHIIPSEFSPALAMAAAAAVLVIAVQAVMLVALLSGSKEDGGYRVATGGEIASPSSGSFVLIRFTENAKADDIANLLRGIGAIIVDGPKPGGTFKIRISLEVLPAEEREAIRQRLRDHADIVAFVAPTQ